MGVWGGEAVQCCGSRESQCARALGHVPESSEGQDCQGTAAALPSALTPGRGAVLPNGATGAPRGTSMAGAVRKQGPGGGGLLLVVIEIIYFYFFTDRYIYIFIRENAAGNLGCHLPGW